MRRSALLVVLLLVAWRAPQARAQQALELTLEVGEQRVLSSDGVNSYSEGVTGVIDVRLTKDGSSFVVVGQRAGRTSLLFMMSDGHQVQYRVVVDDSGQSSGAGPDGAPSQIGVAARDNIRLDFYFVQLMRDDGHQVGVSWPASIGGGSLAGSFDLLSGSFSEATAVVTEQALPRLDLAQSAGWAKLMRQAAVITANGTEANFSGGGEVNIPVESALAVGVRQISFGSSVKVQPRYDRSTGRIELTIHAEVSDLASDHGSGIPGRVTSNLDSVVNLELGQSLVLAGLSAHSESSSTTGLAGLSQIPILGVLFGSHRSALEQTQNLIFIVPSVVDSVPVDAREHVKEALDAFREFDGDFEQASLPSTSAPSSTPIAPKGGEP
jgi:pilus assembly protein CpaC